MMMIPQGLSHVGAFSVLKYCYWVNTKAVYFWLIIINSKLPKFGILYLVTGCSLCISKWHLYAVKYNVLYLCFDGVYVLFISTIG